ncbi:hypothetical protein [Listeria welshimeri]|nr:hypothetical protein [Listeria welshimeri]
MAQKNIAVESIKVYADKSFKIKLADVKRCETLAYNSIAKL